MPLTTGSIAFVGFNADGNDNLAFVALTEIASGESIVFEDNEWNGTAFVDTNENAFVWTAGAALAAGTVVRIDNIGSGTIAASTGTVALAEGRGTNRGIGASNEVIYAYQGSAAAPTAFLTAIANSGFSATNGLLTNTGLTPGVNAIEFTTGIDVAAYNGTRSGQSFDELRSTINNPANWQTQDGAGDQSVDGVAPDVPFSDAAFSVVVNTPNLVNLAVSTSTATETGKTAVTVTATATKAVTGNQTIDLAVSGTGITATDYTLSNAVISIADGQTTGTATFTVVDDAAIEGTEIATLTIANPSAGIALGTTLSQNVTILDNDRSVIQKVGSAASTNGAEIAAFDPASKRLFVVAGSIIEVYTMDGTGALTAAGALVTGFTVPAGTRAIPNSVAVKDGLVAVAYAIQDTTTLAQQAGRVSFYEAATGNYRRDLVVGAVPDMVVFSPDGKTLLVANEGEPNSYGQATSVDPEGSVSIIDLAGGVDAATSKTAGFEAFNSQITSLRAAGVRIFGPGATVAQDLEPEYIAFAADGKTARVTLQENNAIAVLDLTSGQITEILPLGRKSFSSPGNGIDPSDRDNISSIRPVPVFGLYQPDAIASFTANGQDYYITANEGDARDYPGFSEEVRVGSSSYVLDPTLFPDAATLKQAANLGRLTVTNASGDVDGDGDFDRIEAFGGRSFSIWNSNGTLVFDSGSALEEITLAQAPTLFNSDGVAGGLDTRSDNKGPEPEGVAIGRINGRNYAFIGLERTGDVVVYDVTSPTAPQFLQYVNLPEDVGAEGVSFIAAADSPTGKPLLVTANEVSRTVSAFTVDVPTRIAHIQGTSHTSPLVGQSVSGVPGIVTAVTTNGFYLQDPSPDDDDRTSDAIFVFTSSAPGVAVGDRLEVSGTVSEFRPGGATGTSNLTITQIVAPTIAKISSGNALPAAVLLGQNGRIIPTTIIDNDSTGNIETGTTNFDPQEDGIDFYESLEAMRVEIRNPIAVSRTNQFGEIWVTADSGANATNKTVRGGLNISPTDFNPERIQIDDTLAGATSPAVSVGAKLSNITGVVSYSFGNYEVLPTTIPTVVAASTLEKEVTNLVGAEKDLTVATFNVENLGADDSADRFNALAARIVSNLKSPDIITLQEVRDNNGATNDGVVDASQTYQKLIDAIVAAGGPTYQYRQVDPVNNADGGEPGGNIRVGFLFVPSRVQFVDVPGGTSTSNTTVTNTNNIPTLSASPGRIDPTNTAFDSSRKPLVGQFLFQGESIYIVANHWNSKGGDRPLFGVDRTGTLASEVQRVQQATVVKDFVAGILAIDPQANVIVAGDLNDFEFSQPLAVLESAGLKNLVDTLPQNERYGYVFDGNGQNLDHILVSDRLSRQLSGFDIVHINSEFASQDSDHDPLVAKFSFKNFNFSAASYQAGEGNVPGAAAKATIKVDRTGDTTGTSTVQIQLSDGTATGVGVAPTAPETKGIASSKTPYIVPTAAGVSTVSLLTVGDGINGYRMAGIPDGLGAIDNGNGTFTVFMNHEIGATNSIVRDHGSKGSYVSKWVFNKSDFSLVSGDDLIQKIILWDGTAYVEGNGTPRSAIGRLCSSDLALASAFYNSATGLGTEARILLNGEEIGAEGRAFGHIVTGSNAGTSYELPYLGKFSWENSVANPTASNKTVVVGLDDSAGGQVYFYVGNKTNSGNEIEKAGLSNGKLFGLKVTGLTTETNSTSLATGSRFSLADLGTVQNKTGAVIETESTAAGVTKFMRPEDGAWDPSNPNDFYFATTASFTGPSRLWRLRFDDGTNPEAGGTIEAVLDGTEGHKMLDNLAIDRYGNILLQEDPGNQAHNAKIWQYNIAKDELKEIAQHDPTRFITGGANFLTQDEESSGIIDVQDILGAGWFLADVQAHYTESDPELVQGGQLLAIFNPDTYNTAADYLNSKLTVTFAPGETAKEVTIPIFGDNRSEGNETVNLTLVDPSTGAVIGKQQPTATLTIQNNVAPALTGTPATLANGTEDVPYTITTAALLTGFTDADSTNLSIQNVRVGNTPLTVNASGEYIFTPPNNANGNFTVAYSVSDGTSATATTLNFALSAVNDAPAGLALTNAVSSIIENSDTTTRIKVADIGFTDDEAGTNNLTLTGADASFFEIDNRILYLKAGTKVDFEAKTKYQVTVNVEDPSLAGSKISTDYTLNVTDVNDPFILQLLHASDQEAGVLAIDDAPRFSAVLNALKNQDSNKDGRVDYANTIVLSSGDAYIPGLFLDASRDASLAPLLGKEGQGRADIIIQNELGFQAIAFGNHEFDLGTSFVKSLLAPDGAYPGAKFPYLSSNLNFSANTDLSSLVTADGQEASTISNKIAKSTVITVNGEKIGVVGATTPTLPRISTPGTVTVTPTNATDFNALAAEIQKSVDALTATGINKVVLLSHMQQIGIEQQLAGLLKDVDIIMAGGSNTRLVDSTDVLRAGDTKQGDYPILTKSATGDNLAIINTDGNYKYVGRLVVEFDNAGKIVPTSIDPSISGAYATDVAGVERLNAQSLVDPEVQKIADALRQVVVKLDSNVLGKTDVFLNGTRSDVRTQETNLGNLTADANLAYAKNLDPTVTISIKNGGGVRNNIGSVSIPAGGFDAVKEAPAANPVSGKPAGGISQPDLQSSLSFNNSLTLLTLTAEQLKQTIEHGVAATTATATPGQFPQVSGISFSFDITKAAGSRVQTLAVLNGDGSIADVVVKNGVLQGNKDRTFRTVTLGFLADGGDSYPLATFLKDNPTRSNRIDLIGESGTNDLNLNGKIDGPIDPTKFDLGRSNFAASGTEQDAFAEYLQTNFATTAFNISDTDSSLDTRIQRLDKRADGVLATNTLSAGVSAGIVKIGAVNNISQIEFNITKLGQLPGVNELIVFEIDDTNKQIDLEDILSKGNGKILASTLANSPTGFGDSQTRTLNFDRNSNLGFALIKNGTAADILAGKNKDVILSTATPNYLNKLEANGFELDFEGMKVTAKTTSNPLPLGTNLQTGNEGELIDLRSQSGKVESTFSIFRDAAFNNEVYFYKVDDAAGNIGTPTTNTQEYINRALANLVKGSDGNVVKLTGSNGTTSTVKATIDGGSIIAPMIVVNGTLTQLQDNNPNNDPQVYVPFIGINSDKTDRVRLLGDNTFGFEDLGIGGDFDYNDVIVKVAMQPL